jgi:hypothetical protein
MLSGFTCSDALPKVPRTIWAKVGPGRWSNSIEPAPHPCTPPFDRDQQSPRPPPDLSISLEATFTHGTEKDGELASLKLFIDRRVIRGESTERLML